MVWRSEEGKWWQRLRGLPACAPYADALACYLGLLEVWGGACDLTGSLGEEELLRDHLLESLVAAPLLGAGRLLDLGSGNGFPAIPLLVARRDVGGLLLEPRKRRWAFLKEVVRELGLNAEVRRMSVASVEPLAVENVTVRALARSVWEERGARLLAPGGRFFWWAGPRAEVDAPAGLELVVTCALPNPQRGRLVVWKPCST